VNKSCGEVASEVMGSGLRGPFVVKGLLLQRGFCGEGAFVAKGLLW
jgi:hypothetical protein